MHYGRTIPAAPTRTGESPAARFGGNTAGGAPGSSTPCAATETDHHETGLPHALW